jgi:hypothetical protein
MNDRLEALSPPLRYAVYVLGVVLVLFLAVGMGASAAAVVGWQLGRTEMGTSEAGGPETADSARAPDATEIESTEDSTTLAEADTEVSFVHRADRGNSRGDYTVISDPSIDGGPNAIVLASPTVDRENGESYDHNIGVWYAGAIQKWAIFNQDRAPVQVGTTFEVVFPQASSKFLHTADLLNTSGNYTYLDDRLTNSRPDAVLSVTQNWNPGGGRGVYNNHPVDTVYDKKLQQWAVYNSDGAPMPEGASFNVAVEAGADASAR